MQNNNYCYGVKLARVSKKFESFLSDAFEKFGSTYDYTPTYLKSLSDIISFTCPNCGIVQMRASDHLKHKTGCNKCKPKSYTPEQLFEMCFNANDGKYSYENANFKKSKDYINVTCPKHGIFKVRTREHYTGTGCLKCLYESQCDTQEDFIEKVKARFGDFYLFDKLKYTRQEDEVIITCPVHGDFTMKAYKFLHGVGCEKCKHSYKSRETYLYVIQYEDWVKVGVSVDANTRLSKINYVSGKEFVPIKTYKFDTFFKAEQAEKMALTYLGNRYLPIVTQFTGSTETFQGVDVAKLLNFIEKDILLYF